MIFMEVPQGSAAPVSCIVVLGTILKAHIPVNCTPLGLMDNSQVWMRDLIMLMDMSGGISDDFLQIIDFNYRQHKVNISQACMGTCC